MSLETFWFIVVAVFWTGFFVLEGFDFGVGVLHTVVGRTDDERRVAINSIGPFWDGNEVWLIVAGAAMFAAFPAWYATLFSGLYLALLLLLVALIARGVAFEFRGKLDAPRWRRGWTWATDARQRGHPAAARHRPRRPGRRAPGRRRRRVHRHFADIFTAYGVWFGSRCSRCRCCTARRSWRSRPTGAVRVRARALGVHARAGRRRCRLVFAVWSPSVLERARAVAVLAAAAAAARPGREGWAFTATALAMARPSARCSSTSIPNVLVSSTDAAYTLTVSGAASGSYALKVMTVAAVVLVPLVLLYQGWSYRVFRARVGPPSRSHESA